MKKLFTIVVAALCALTVSAKETIPGFTPGTLTFGGWSWNTISTLGQGEVINNGNGTADDSGVTYFDASDHDYVVFKYSTATCAKMKAIVQYNCKGTAGQWGPEFNEGSQEFVLNVNGGIMAIKLNADYSDKVFSIAMQDPGSAGTVDVTDVYFATEEEYLAAKAEADKIEKVMVLDGEGGTHTLAAGDWGWDSKWLDATDISAFNTAVIEVESVIGHGKINFEAFEIDLPASETAYTATADISSVASIKQYAYQNLYKIDEASEVPDGETVIKVKKVYLTSKTKQEVDEEISTGISNMIAAPKAQNNVRYNFAGQRVGNGAKMYIMNGKKYMK
ncbi:MAG: hypothetical protein SPE04_10640 [Prevotella sp.]|nr:hypothetical protein [Prevotella sp.]